MSPFALLPPVKTHPRPSAKSAEKSVVELDLGSRSSLPSFPSVKVRKVRLVGFTRQVTRIEPQSIRVHPCASVVKNVWVIFAKSAGKSVAELDLWIEADSALSVSFCKFLSSPRRSQMVADCIASNPRLPGGTSGQWRGRIKTKFVD